MTPERMTDKRTDQLVSQVFPPDRDSHYGAWSREIAGELRGAAGVPRSSVAEGAEPCRD
jgi:hypothetical protein